MSHEIFLYIFGAALVPLVGWTFSLTRKVDALLETGKRLIHMHEHADEYGFGTRNVSQVIEDNTKAMRELSHYVQWWIRHQNGGQSPPPPLRDVDR